MTTSLAEHLADVASRFEDGGTLVVQWDGRRIAYSAVQGVPHEDDLLPALTLQARAVVSQVVNRE